MDASAFVEKWKRSKRTEKSASQEHFFDLCELFRHPKPGDVDSTGLIFAAERRVTKEGGGRGYADFFKQGAFAWEYKKRGADLNDAFNQLLQYSGDLGNPPLLVASDMDWIEIRTRFTGFPTTVFAFSLDDFAKPKNLETLRRVFFDQEMLRPEKTIETITKEAAAQLAEIAPGVRQRHEDPAKVAHFLDRLIFCLFAEGIGLLPNKVFSRIVEKYQTRDPRRIMKDIAQLFEAMAEGGDCYGETIPHINGNLFDDTPSLELNGLEIEVIHRAAALDWSQMDPSIFGTLFERVMDPDQRAELGAHYTGFTDIATLVEPVVMEPLRREWNACKASIEAFLPDPVGVKEGPSLFSSPTKAARSKADAIIATFLKHLRTLRVLDPACGSGNFLYVTLRMLKDLEYEVLVFARHHGLSEFALDVGPHQLRGIEKNPYAFDLAQMTVWIGLLQWHRANGFPYLRNPVLQPLDTFENKDAILDLTNPDFPVEPEWPEAEFIVGNPPFLGGSKIRGELGDSYVDSLFGLYRARVPSSSDLCCYWFEKARNSLKNGRVSRVGLLATQGIRGGANRSVLERIKESGDIFFGESDRNWILDGANVHVSMVGFDEGKETSRSLNGKKVKFINADLTSFADITTSKPLKDNCNLWCYGSQQKANFDLIFGQGLKMLYSPNPDGRPNSDVIRPSVNGTQVLRETHESFVIDFALETDIARIVAYEMPFEYVKKEIFPIREHHREAVQRNLWWRHARPSPRYRNALVELSRVLVTTSVAKHRIFLWLYPPKLADHALIVFNRSEDYFFGILHSRPHEIWARATGTQVRERESGFRYTPKSCFETFPFPKLDVGNIEAISAEARHLDRMRMGWLTPPAWISQEFLEFPGSMDGPWARFVTDPDARGIGTVRYPRFVAKDAHVFDLAKRTLTNLYNERPTWLDLAHRALDEAVFAAYGWPSSMTDDELLSALLDLNLERASSSTAGSAGETTLDEAEEE